MNTHYFVIKRKTRGDVSKYLSLFFRIAFLLTAFCGLECIGYQKVEGAVMDPSVPPDVLRDFETLRNQLSKNPRDVPTLNSIGIVYARVGQLREAVSLWNFAMTVNPNYIHLYNNLGSALKSLKRYDEARKVYRQGLALSPSYWIHYNLGLLEQECRNPSEAIKCFQTCLKLNNSFEPANRKLREMGFWSPPPQTPVMEQFKSPIPTVIPNLPSSSIALCHTAISSSDSKTSPKPEIPEHLISVEDCVKVLNKINASASEKLVALTFDDGPHSHLTPSLLDFLRSEGILATFFLIGSRGEVYPDIVSRISTEGHEVGNHTWSHHSLAKISTNSALAELQRTADLFSSITGKQCRLVRPPFGSTNTRVVDLIHSQGWRQILWDADSRDWQGGTPNQALRRILRDFFPGAIILFHDIHPLGLKVLPILVTALKRCGYRFVTISQLIGHFEPSS